MSSQDKRSMSAAKLLAQAEAIVRGNAASRKKGQAMTPEETAQTLHELHVHQVELELQNEELRRARAELDASQARYFELYDLAPVGYCTINAKGVILEANLAATTLLGVDRHALVSQPISRFIFKEDQDSFYLFSMQHLKPDEPRALELRMVTSNGDRLWVLLSVAGAQDVAQNRAREDASTALLRVVLVDITARRQAEAAREAIISASMDAIISVDENQRIVVFSPAAERLFGVSAAEAAGQTIDRFIPARFREAHHAHVGQFAQSGVTARARGQLTRVSALRQDGSEFPIEASISHDVIDGKHFFSATMRDISERERAEAAREILEAQLRESQKMQAIGTLAGGIAHDFNNILATILGNVELAYQDASASPRALESLTEIRKAGSRARDLVQQILSFSRRQPTSLTRTALCRVVDESVRLLRATLPARLILDVQCDHDVPDVLADASQIEQVLINLATNAMQAMRGEPGRIKIRGESYRVAEEHYAGHEKRSGGNRALLRPGRYARLTVSDNGPGMDAATRARIFEPFFTTKPVGEGTGLGLSVVHGIVQGHKGAITVHSRLEKGATFMVYLPAAEDEPVAGDQAKSDADRMAAAVPPPAPDAGFIANKHILYVDDDESLVFLVKRLLERRGYFVSGFTEQREALATLRADPRAFDLVVTDYNMPGKSGLDVAREVRIIREDLPVAIASGFIDETLQKQAEGAGVRELILKASAVEDLCDAFARLAQGVGKATGEQQ